MVSLSRTLSLGLFLAALGLGAASGQQPPKDKAAAQRVESPQPPDKPKTTAGGHARPADVRIAPEKPQAPEQKPDTPKPKGGEGFPLGTFADWVIVIFTGALTWVAFKQHQLETGLAKDAEQQRKDVKASIAEAARAATAMETMAEAAQRSANAASTVQRPWIKLTVGKPRPAYVKEGRLYVHVPIRFTNVGMTPTNGFSMTFECNAHPGSGKITLDQLMKRLNRKVEKPAVIQDIIYPNDPYEAEPVFSILVDEIAGDQMDRFFIAVTFEVHYFWAEGRGHVGFAGIVRPAGRGATKFNLDGFSENRSVSAVFTGLDSWAR